MNPLKSLDVGARVPPLLQGLCRVIWPGTIWSVAGSDAVHLTFDDGPDPEVTPWVLDILAQHGAKATFFVVGDQAAKHPDILDLVKKAGHAVGGHTMRHELGWRTGTTPYVKSALASIDGLQPLFRPPYGKMTPAQARRIGAHADLIMWDVLSGDFALDAQHAQEVATAQARLQRRTKLGSVVVFHDSAKHAAGLKALLPEYLSWLSQNGVSMKAISPCPTRRLPEGA
ncbi:MAG: polysaccharide deacetylase family protein [Flavobacteriales bacterium]